MSWSANFSHSVEAHEVIAAIEDLVFDGPAGLHSRKQAEQLVAAKKAAIDLVASGAVGFPDTNSVYQVSLNGHAMSHEQSNEGSGWGESIGVNITRRVRVPATT